MTFEEILNQAIALLQRQSRVSYRALKRYAQIEDADDPRTRRARLTGQVLTLDESLQDTLLPLLALLDALPEDSPLRQLEPPRRRQHTRAALTIAIDIYRTMDMTLWLPQAKAALAQVEGQ